MKWTLKLVTEVVPGKPIEEEVATIEREELVSPATVGLAIAEGKLILERLQRSVVTSQIHRHGLPWMVAPLPGRLEGNLRDCLRQS
jgi:hypothetical protein